jgi:hypothetical protein
MKSSSIYSGDGLGEVIGDFLPNRRMAASLTLVGMASLFIIALYQIGVLKRLPEPPMRGLDAEKVNGSKEAYEILGVPDAVLGLGSYATTLGLAAMGKANRSEARPWLPLALAAKCSIDTLQAARLTRMSWVKFRAFSLYSLITVVATFLTLPVVLPEALAAWRKLGSNHP